jgi:hypothetical protein
MYYPACGVLLAAGLILNCRDRRMLALTALVGASIFLPVPRETAEQFYAFCIVAEVTIALAVLALRNSAGVLIAETCALLVVAHLMGYALDGHPPFSPYRVIVKLLEVSQLVACVALSPILAPILRNHDATTS